MNSHRVKAPAGLEAIRYWEDRPHGAGGWCVQVRITGYAWWTTLGDIGHGWLEPAELDRRAEEMVRNDERVRDLMRRG